MITKEYLSQALSGFYFLNKEIARLQQDLEELESRANWIASSRPTVYKKGKQVKTAEDYIVEMADLKTIICNNIHKSQQERVRLEQYISGICDAETRLIFRLRYINGMTWEEIGYETNMSHMTAIRKHNKYINNHNIQME